MNRHRLRNQTWLLMHLALLCMMASCTHTPALAQTGSGSARGVLTDPTGAVVVGAVVTLRNIETSVTQATKSGDEGDYLLRSIQPGVYSLKVSARSLEELTEANIVIVANQVAVINKQLAWSSRPELVIVTVGGGPLLPMLKPPVQAGLPGLSKRRTARRHTERRHRRRRHNRHLLLTQSA